MDNQTKFTHQQMIYELKSQSIPEKWQNVTFEQLLIPNNLNAPQREKFKLIIKKIENIDVENCEKVITFSSKSNGIGKTHLLFCLYKKYIFKKYEKGEVPSAKFIKEYDLYLEIQETYNNNFYGSEREIMEKYISSRKLLAIDDLFATKDNEFARQKIFTLIDKRTDYLGYPTIVTTNLTLDEISSIDTRIASRIDNQYFFDLSSLTIDFRKNSL